MLDERDVNGSRLRLDRLQASKTREASGMFAAEDDTSRTILHNRFA